MKIYHYNELFKKHEYASPKTKESKRTIGIDDSTIESLIWWRNLQKVFLLSRGYNVNSPDQPVFTTEDNTFIHASHLRKVLKRVIDRNNLPDLNIHGFRHTHCSLLFEAGVEIQNVKDRLGHSDIKTTMNIYAHVTKSERKKTADIFNDFMESSFM